MFGAGSGMAISMLLLVGGGGGLPASAGDGFADHQDLAYYLDDKSTRQPVRNSDDWQVRRGHILGGMRRVMGSLPGKQRRVPLDVKVLEEVKVGELRRRKITFQSEPGDRVAAYLFLPAGTVGRGPAVLCLQQTNRRGKLEAAGIEGSPDLAYALHLARRGYVTLAPDYPGFGESKYDFAPPPPRGHASGTIKAVWDNIRAVDLLVSLPEVDPKRIGVIGHSLGGHNAMFTSAFEPRLKVIVSNCGFTRFGKDDMPSWTGPRYMPRIATVFGNDAKRVPFDFPEIIGTFSPRPFLAIAPKRDRDFDYTGVQDSIRSARFVYRLYNKPGHLQAAYPDTGHAFPAAARRLAYEFLDRHLKR